VRSVAVIGGGIQVSPNASRILHRLGLGGELARMGVRPEHFHQRRWDDGAQRHASVSGGLVGQDGDALADRPGIDEPQIDRLARIAEAALAGPDDDREDHQPPFVDEVVLSA
jgi:2-polyprenyl-6-methoxyphenol hydroxylase-like FAD-dependent oxidoreductase